MNIINMAQVFKQLLDDNYTDCITFISSDGTDTIYIKHAIISDGEYLYALLTMAGVNDNTVYFYKMIMDDEKMALELVSDEEELIDLLDIYLNKYQEKYPDVS